MHPRNGFKERQSSTTEVLDNASVQQEEPCDEKFHWDLDVITNLLALYMTLISSTWSLFALPLSLTYIDRAFPDQASQSAWVAAVVGLVQCVISLFIGELSDIFGRRYFIVSANVLKTAGSLISSRGSSVSMVIGGQTITGIGTSFGMLTTPLIAEVVPKRSRSVVIGIGTGLAAFISAIGAVGIGAFQKFDVGGHNQGWRAGGYITVGTSFLALLLAVFFYHPSHRPNPESLSVWKRLIGIDWFGIAVGASGLTLVLLGLQFGGRPHPWQSPLVLSFLIIGAVLLIVFAIWEAKCVGFGLFPTPLFEHRNYSIILATQFVEGMAVNSGVAFLVQIQLLMFTDDAILAQVRNIPYRTSSLVGAAIVGAVIYKTKETYWALLGSLALGILAPGLLSLLVPNSNYALWFFGVVSLGVSIAGMGVSVSTIASLCTPNQLIATGLSIMTSIRGLGGAVGIVTFSQVFAAKAAVCVPSYIASATVAAGLPPTSVQALIFAALSRDEAAIAEIPGVSPAVLEALGTGMKRGYARSFAFMWYSMLPFVGVALLLAFFLKKTRDLTNQEVASKVQGRLASRHKFGVELKGNNAEHVEKL